MNKSVTPMWSKRAQKALIDLGMSKKALAAELNVNYTQLVNVLNGMVYNEVIKQRICEFCKVKG